jgi:hypothetical protein
MQCRFFNQEKGICMLIYGYPKCPVEEKWEECPYFESAGV